MSTLLETGGLSVRFGGVHALSDVDLKVEEGQLVGLIGPNGAGKTTFIDAISGFVPCTGSVDPRGHGHHRHGAGTTVPTVGSRARGRPPSCSTT